MVKGYKVLMTKIFINCAKCFSFTIFLMELYFSPKRTKNEYVFTLITSELKLKYEKDNLFLNYAFGIKSDLMEELFLFLFRFS